MHVEGRRLEGCWDFLAYIYNQTENQVLHWSHEKEPEEGKSKDGVIRGNLGDQEELMVKPAQRPQNTFPY